MDNENHGNRPIARPAKRLPILDIVKLKADCDQLEKFVYLLEQETFVLLGKTNRIKNVLQHKYSKTTRLPKQLSEICAAITRSMEPVPVSLQSNVIKSSDNTIGALTPTHPKTQDQDLSITSTAVIKSPMRTAHLVKPHAVNGHVLFVPTINLTRMPTNLSLMHQENQDTTTRTDESGSELVQQSFVNGQNQAGPSTSTVPNSPSALLSGTFQEVRIYLNNIDGNKREHNSPNVTRPKKSEGRKRRRC